MNEPDFSGINPLRVPEARRRIEAINAYLRLASPTSADTSNIASGIGLSRNQFSRLVRVWRDHRDARLLVIGKRGAATRDYGINPGAIAIANEIIAAAGFAATLATVAPEIERRCSEEGITPPSRQTIYNYIRTARMAAPGLGEGPPRILAGRMWFHMPVLGEPLDAMPMLLAAVLMPERIIVTHLVSTAANLPPSVGELLDNLAKLQTAGASPRPLLLNADDRRAAATPLAWSGLDQIRSHDRSVQRELSKSFAGQLGPLAVVYQRSMARPATKRVVTRQDEPLPAAQVVAIIAAAVNSHNVAVGLEIPAFELAPR